MLTPYGLKGAEPGDLMQVDVLHVHLLPGVTVYHFTAWDGASRWSVGQVYSRVSSHCAADFLDRLQARCPFPIRAIRIDGGSEFKGAFEQACQAAGIKLYVLPPKRPQRNGGVVSEPTASGAMSSMPATPCRPRSGNFALWSSGGSRSTTC